MAKPRPPLPSSLHKPLRRLYQAQLYGRWFLVSFLWLSLAPWALGQFQADINLLQERFTWVGLHYALAFNLVPSFALIFCVAMTGSTLVWQSGHLLWGLSSRDRRGLKRRVEQIQAIGPHHFLWKWLFS